KASYHDFEWIFIMRDDFSGLVKLTPAVVPDTMTTVDALSEWRSLFGTSELYVSDQASYFISETMQQFARRCNTKQHWTTAYVHYSNGTVEVICKQVLALIRALISELRWNKEDWPWLVKLIEHTINHRPQRRLQWNAPVTVMTGLPSDNPLNVVFHNPRNETGTLTTLSAERILNHVERLQEALDSMHKSVLKATELEREVHRLSDKRVRQRANFGLGDFVLVGIVDRHPNQKLYLKWRGPYKIIELVNGYVFIVENIITQERQQVHGDRLCFYCDSKLKVTEELKTQFAFDNAKFEIETILDVRPNVQSGELELLIHWKGFSDLENSWEPIAIIVTDAPSIVRRFYRAHLHHP